ncbi:four-carbon acid sugar kinase family protein [Rothia sp. AR01]|uniref:3-oxo-tetronate kinase n=1 Tax=Rothia santali TaxID=2949643 RepID=A0A9X2HCZ5_9MICC|nr:3-oxo-tetronate kinase [Rothia santali]MCP3427086.1 four-carbon acid sugar kinase family protein [Rothia santali]
MHRIGVIADDFTGATDIATAYASAGFRTAVFIEDAVAREEAADADVLVVALKTRTAPREEAVAASLDALRDLRRLGCERFYVKYCSTFDSTDEGNIGPILDAAAAELGAARTVVVPAYPDNGRTTYLGRLFVGDQLLEESPMREHPLTPMRRSRLRDLLSPQTGRAVGEVHLPAVHAGPEALRAALDALPEGYAVIDAVENADLRTIHRATRDDLLVSGGAGLALGAAGGSGTAAGSGADDAAGTSAAGEDASSGAAPVPPFPPLEGRSLVVCGSASSMTRAQVADAMRSHPTRALTVDRLAEEAAAEVDDVAAWIAGADRAAVPVVYSVATAGDLRHDAAAAIEDALAELARRAVAEGGVRHLIVAGGETSGAVTKALGIGRLDIGPRISPGVCWSRARTRAGESIDIALKSGNFGTEDMFSSAWKELGEA